MDLANRMVHIKLKNRIVSTTMKNKNKLKHQDSENKNKKECSILSLQRSSTTTMPKSEVIL